MRRDRAGRRREGREWNGGMVSKGKGRNSGKRRMVEREGTN
jgi:hypothetical protein